jgi:hypothetical protein
VSYEENSNLGNNDTLTVVNKVEVAKKLARKLGSGRYKLNPVQNRNISQQEMTRQYTPYFQLLL